MNQSQRDRVKGIFGEARGLPRAQRESFIVAACGPSEDGKSIASEVRGLLDAQDNAEGFLEGATGGVATVAASYVADAASERVGSRIGPYKLLELIGEGGFGLVYMAQQEQPIRRRVALKIIKLGLETNQVIARFEQERQALAMMDHPHIAKVLDAGTTPTGRPYFAMELVRGEPITTFCDNKKLSIPQRLELFAKVCHAVQHAHQKGIIHRDLKPSNVLVTVGDGDTPVPKVIDFGIAKATQARLTEKTLFTEFRQMIGTPAYMSPEQAGLGAASGLDIDTRSDVYSLGALLYELLTGVTPFDAQRLRSAAFGELQRMIREDDPPRPSTRVSTEATIADVAARRQVDPKRLGLQVRGELDWVVMKCLEKDRARRYTTAEDLARDVNRYLKQEPLEAGPPTAAYRVRKFLRRNKGKVVLAAALGGMLIVGTIGTSIGLVWAVRERNAAIAAREAEAEARGLAEAAATAESAARVRADRLAADATRLAYGLGISSAIAAMNDGNIALAVASLRECPEPLRGWEWDHLSWAADPSISVFETPPDTDAFAGSADGKLFTRSPSGEVLVFEIATGKILSRFSTPIGRSISYYAIVPDPTSRLLIVGQRDPDGKSLLSVLDASSGRTLWKMPGTGIGTFADSGRLVLLSVAGGVAVLESATGEQIDFIPVEGAPPSSLFGGNGPGISVIIRVSGNEYLVYSLAENRQIAMYASEENALAHDDMFLSYLSMDQTVLNRMNLTTGTVTAFPLVPQIPVLGMDSLGRGLLAMAAADGRMRVVSSASGETISVFNFSKLIRAWRPVPDGRMILTIDGSGTVRSRNVVVGEQPFVVATRDRAAYGARLSRSADATIVCGWGEARLYDIATGEHRWSSYYTTEMLFATAFSPDGSLVAVGGAERRIALLDARDGRVVSFLPFNRPGTVTVLAWSPSGDRLVAGLTEGDVIEWDTRNPTEPPIVWADAHDTAVADIAFSDNGRWLASASASDLRLPDFHAKMPGGKNEAVLWDASARSRIRTLSEGGDGNRRLAFAPGETALAVGTTRALTLHDLGTGRGDQTAAIGHVRALAFSPDGSRLAAVLSGSGLRVLDAQDLSTLATLAATSGNRVDLGFTPDGATLALASSSVPVTAWEQSPPANPERRWLASRASSLIAPLFDIENELSERVVQRLEKNTSLDDALRHAAIAAARARGDNPNRIINIAAVGLREPILSAERSARYANLSRVGVEGAPDSGWAWSTLALAEYRVGRFEQAIAAAQRSTTLGETQIPGGTASDWAVIAMAAHRLGRTEENRCLCWRVLGSCNSSQAFEIFGNIV